MKIKLLMAQKYKKTPMIDNRPSQATIDSVSHYLPLPVAPPPVTTWIG